jgi:protein-disulfide isomerase
MIAQWKIAALGALSGAVIAVGVVFGSAVAGYFPQPQFDGRLVRAYLLKHPEILAEVQDRYNDKQEALRAIGLERFFDPKVAFVTGPADAKASIVEFFDYNCGHCRNASPAMKAYYEKHRGDTRFAFIDFPIFGDASNAAARAAVAARKQPDKYVAFMFALMGTKGAVTPDNAYLTAKEVGLDVTKLIADMQDPQVDVTLKAAHALAARLLVDGTPTFIFNGRVRAGEVDEATLKDIMAGKAI